MRSRMGALSQHRLGAPMSNRDIDKDLEPAPEDPTGGKVPPQIKEAAADQSREKPEERRDLFEDKD